MIIRKDIFNQYRAHLGNVRVSFGRNNVGALEITDANDYYPFGMKNHLKAGNTFFGVGSYKNYKYNQIAQQYLAERLEEVQLTPQ